MRWTACFVDIGNQDLRYEPMRLLFDAAGQPRQDGAARCFAVSDDVGIEESGRDGEQPVLLWIFSGVLYGKRDR